MPSFKTVTGVAPVNPGDGGGTQGQGAEVRERYMLGEAFKRNKQSFWSDPRNVAKFKDTFSTIPEDQRPTWANTQGLDSAYSYLEQYNASKPLDKWETPTNWDDPYWSIIDTIPTPPIEALDMYDKPKGTWSEVEKSLEEQGLIAVPISELTQRVDPDTLQKIQDWNKQEGIADVGDPTKLFVSKTNWDALIQAQTPDPDYMTNPNVSLDRKAMAAITGKAFIPDEIKLANDTITVNTEALKGSIPASVVGSVAPTVGGLLQGGVRGGVKGAITSVWEGAKFGAKQSTLQSAAETARTDLKKLGADDNVVDGIVNAVVKVFDTLWYIPQLSSEVTKRAIGILNLYSYLSQKEGLGEAVKDIFQNFGAAKEVAKYTYVIPDDHTLRTYKAGGASRGYLVTIASSQEKQALKEEARKVTVIGKVNPVAELTDEQFSQQAVPAYYERIKAIMDGTSQESLSDIEREITNTYGYEGQRRDLINSILIDPANLVGGGGLLIGKGIGKGLKFLGVGDSLANAFLRQGDAVKALQDYSAQVGVAPHKALIPEDAKPLGATLQRAANGLLHISIDKKGVVTTGYQYTAQNPPKGIAKFNPFLPTSQSLAKAKTELLVDSLRLKSREFEGDPQKLMRWLEEVTKHSPNAVEEAARLNNMGEDVRTIYAILKDGHTLSEVKKIAAEYAHSQKDRELFTSLMDIIGEKNKDGQPLAKKFVERIQGMDADGFLKMQEEVKNSTHPEAQRIAEILSRENFFRLKESADKFSDGRWHITSDRASYAMMEKMVEGMSGFVTNVMGLRKLSWLDNLSTMMKNANTMIVLWNNPWYVLNNMISDTGYNVIWGNFSADPMLQKKMIDTYGDEIIPTRLGGLMDNTHINEILHEAISQTPLEKMGIAPRQLLGYASARVLNHIAHQVRDESKLGKMATTTSASMRFLMDGIPNIAGKLAQKWEAFSGLTTYLKQFDYYYRNVFPSVVEEMERSFPEPLRKSLEEVGVDAHALHQLLKTVRKPGDIEKVIAGNYNLIPLESVLSPEHIQVLKEYGVFDKFSRLIREAKSPEAVTGIIHTIKEEVHDATLRRVAMDAETSANEVAMKIKANGTRYAIALLSDLYRMHQKHSNDTYATLDRIRKDKNRSTIKKAEDIERIRNDWDIVWAKEQAIYAGVIRALDGDDSTHAEVIRQAFSLRKGMWKEFYKAKSDLQGVVAHINRAEGRLKDVQMSKASVEDKDKAEVTYAQAISDAKVLLADVISRSKNISRDDAYAEILEKYDFTDAETLQDATTEISNDIYGVVSGNDKEVLRTILDVTRNLTDDPDSSLSFADWGDRIQENRDLEDALNYVYTRGDLTPLNALVDNFPEGSVQRTRLDNIRMEALRINNMKNSTRKYQAFDALKKQVEVENYTYTLPQGLDLEGKGDFLTANEASKRLKSALEVLASADPSGNMLLDILKKATKDREVQEAKTLADLLSANRWKTRKNVLRELEKAVQKYQKEQAELPPVTLTGESVPVEENPPADMLAEGETAPTPEPVLDNSGIWAQLETEGIPVVNDVASLLDLVRTLSAEGSGNLRADNGDSWKVHIADDVDAEVHNLRVIGLNGDAKATVREFARENLTDSWQQLIDNNPEAKGKLTVERAIEAHVDMVDALVKGVANRSGVSEAEVWDKYLSALGEATMKSKAGVTLGRNITNVILISRESKNPDTLMHELTEAYLNLISLPEFRGEFAHDIERLAYFAARNLPSKDKRREGRAISAEKARELVNEMFRDTDGKFDFGWMSRSEEVVGDLRNIVVNAFMNLLRKQGISTASKVREGTASIRRPQRTGAAIYQDYGVMLIKPHEYKNGELVYNLAGTVPHVFEDGWLYELSPLTKITAEAKKYKVYEKITDPETGLSRFEPYVPGAKDEVGDLYIQKASPHGNHLPIRKSAEAFWKSLLRPHGKEVNQLGRLTGVSTVQEAMSAFRMFFYNISDSLGLFHEGEENMEDMLRSWLDPKIYAEYKKLKLGKVGDVVIRDVEEYLSSPEFKAMQADIKAVRDKKQAYEQASLGGKMAIHLTPPNTPEEGKKAFSDFYEGMGNALEKGLKETGKILVMVGDTEYSIEGNAIQLNSKGLITNPVHREAGGTARKIEGDFTISPQRISIISEYRDGKWNVIWRGENPPTEQAKPVVSDDEYSKILKAMQDGMEDRDVPPTAFYQEDAHWRASKQDIMSEEERKKLKETVAADSMIQEYADTVMTKTVEKGARFLSVFNKTEQEAILKIVKAKDPKFGDDLDKATTTSFQNKKKVEEPLSPAKLAFGFVENMMLPKKGDMYLDNLHDTLTMLDETERLYNRSNSDEKRQEAVTSLMNRYGWDEAQARKYATDKMLLPTKVGGITEEAMLESLRQKNPGLSEEQLHIRAEAAMMQLKAYLGSIGEAQTRISNEAQRWGLMQKDNSQFNYGARTNFDRFADMGVPYQFWYSRSALMWAKLAISRPMIFNAYTRWEDFKRRMPSVMNLPTRLQGKIGIPAPWAGDEFGTAFIDPSKVLFPMAQMLEPVRNWNTRVATVNSQTITVLQQMFEEEEITEAEYRDAITNKQGAIWDKANQEALETLETDTSPVSMARMAFQPNYFVDVVSKALLDGKDLPFVGKMAFRKSDIQSPPLVKNFKMLTGAIGVNGGTGIDLGDPLRAAFGLPENTPFEEANIEKQVVWEVMRGNITPQQGQEALINKGSDVNWVKAQQSAQDYARKKFLGQGLAMDFFPEPEQKSRQLRAEFSPAMDALISGDRTLYNKFVGDHPEYAVQLSAWRDPQVRMRKYIISDIWQKYMNLPELEKKHYRETLGDTFQQSFMSKPTRNYDEIELSTLLQWAKTLGAFVPKKFEESVAPIPTKLPPQDDVSAFQEYKNLGKKLFPAAQAMEAEMYSLPEDKQDEYRRTHPQLQKYEEWRTQYLGTHLNIVPYTVSEKSQLYGYPPAVQQRVYEYRAREQQLFPNIYAIQDGYFAQPVGYSRRKYLDAHPELKQYWEWRTRFTAVNEDIASLILGSASHAHKLDPTYLAPDDAQRIYKGMNTQTALGWREYLQSGKLSPGTKAELKVLWRKNGQPADTFENFLKQLANAVSL